MQKFGPIDSLSKLNRGEVIDEKSFLKKIDSGKSLRIKFGVDPTKPDLHLGHAVALWKLRELQDKGHKIIFLIGDFTAKIGDPSGRNIARPILSDNEINANTQTYLDQVGKILDIKKCEIRKNSEWYQKMDFAEVLKILGKATIAQVLEREDFSKRIKEGSDVGIHEIIYPIVQGYDSVMLKSDVEVGGQDQKLNMLMGRDLQRKYKQTEQDVLIVPLLVGTDGKKKMSKSYGNYIGLFEESEEQFGKVMSIPDSSINDYLELACNFSAIEIDDLKDRLTQGENPKIIKEVIAERVVEIYHSQPEAQKAKGMFDHVHRQKEMPDEIAQMNIDADSISIIDLLIKSELAKSKSEAVRLISQGGVKVDKEKITDDKKIIDLKNTIILQVGKLKFLKVKSGSKE